MSLRKLFAGGSNLRHFHTSARKYATVTNPPPLLKRSPSEIARRAGALQLVLTRWGIEAAYLAANAQDETGRIRQSFDALTKAVDESKIARSFTETEQKLMDKQFGSWEPVQDISSYWARWESFGILLWTLRIVDGIPRYHVTFPHELLFQATAIVPAFPATVRDFIEYFSAGEGQKPGHIVSENDLREAINRAEAWYWRARAQIVLDLKESLNGDTEEIKEARRKIPHGLRQILQNIDEAVGAASARATADGLIDESVADDFGVDGTAYRSLRGDQLRDVVDIAEFRLGALSWLTGNDWEFERGELKFIHPLGSLWAPHEE
ncbi:hypothetical protein SpCBS45565_g05458 [Spizellomyces sp. 'palustris']|nr:hypothetical protein SpCBS45565_g05458 [Spizellomyces sp. 'palustris']